MLHGLERTEKTFDASKALRLCKCMAKIVKLQPPFLKQFAYSHKKQRSILNKGGVN